MAVWKKNQMNQILFTMVDKTDFASIESGLSSNFTVSVFGVDNGGSAAASDVTLSKAVSVVKSGVYKITAKAAETNWDFIMLKVTHASAADQMIPIQTVTNDDDDIHSKILLIQSNASDIESQLDITASKVLLMQSMLSDVDSQLLLTASQVTNISAILSDVNSAIDSQFLIYLSDTSDLVGYAQSTGSASVIADRVWSRFNTYTSSTVSAVASSITTLKTRVPDHVASLVWDAATASYSDVGSFGSYLETIHSDVSDIKVLAADIDSQLLLNASMISDVQSALDSDIVVRASQFSDIQSNIDAVTATISTSDISNIASRVWSEKYAAHSLASSFGSLFSVIATDGSAGASRALLNQSRISDVDSQLLLNASMISDIDSQLVITASQVLLVLSNVSDVQSQLDLNASMISDIQSAIDSQLILTNSNFSDIMSNIDAVTATVSASDISDIASAVVVAQGSRMSDILSAAVQANSRILVVQSMVSDVQSALDSDILVRQSQFSDIQSNIDAVTATVSASDISDIASAVWAAAVATHGAAAGAFGSLVRNTKSLASDIDSQLLLNASMISDIQSAIDSDIIVRQSQFSDIQSNIDAVTATISASDISDIASRVWSEKYATHSLASSFGSLVSVVATNAASGTSRALLNQSRISDVDSQLLLNASMISDIDSQLVVTASQVLLVLSNLSDVQSQVDLNASMISDVQSALDSDIVVRASQFSDIQSNIDAVTATVSASDISDIASAVWAAVVTTHGAAAGAFGSLVRNTKSLASDIDSQLLLNASMISDIQSALDSDIVVRASQFSDIQSNIDAVTATISASDISDIASRVWSEKYAAHSLASSFGSLFSVVATETNRADSRVLVVQSLVSDVDSQLLLNASMISDVDSQLTITASKIVVLESEVSDIDSQLNLNASMISDIQSALDSDIIVRASQFSDIQSNIDAVTATISASDISDIASRVWSEKYAAHSLASSFGSLVSVVATNATAGASRALLNQSRISDVESQLDVTHSLLSDVESQIDLNASVISDIQSALDSDIIVRASQFSDIQSNIDAVTATVSASDISDIASAVVVAQGSRMSDILSAAVQTNSRALVIQSRISDVESQLDLNASVISDVQSVLSNLDSSVRTTGVQLASGQTATWASALEASAGTIKEGTAKAGTLSTTQMSTTMTEADDVFNGRVLIFKADTTTAELRLQATDISDYANTNGVLTFTAVTTAPSATETFIIV